MGDPKQKFLSEDLLQYNKIVEMDANGNISTKPNNLKKILDATDASKWSENTPSAVIAITGPNKKAKFILMNILLDTVEESERSQQFAINDESLWSRRTANSETIQQFLNMEPTNEQGDSEGVFLFPEPFLIKNTEEKLVSVWITNVCKNETTNLEELDEFLALVCSKIMELECVGNNVHLKVLDPYPPPSFPSRTLYPEIVCLDEVCDTTTHTFRHRPGEDNALTDSQINVIMNTRMAKSMNKLLKGMLNTIMEESVVTTELETNNAEIIPTMKIGNVFKVITLVVQMAKEHRQNREKAQRMMEQSSEDCSRQIRDTFADFVQLWIKNQFKLITANEIPFLYTYLRDETLEKYKSTVHSALWKEFTEHVDARCKAALEEILKNVLMSVERLLKSATDENELLGYLSPVKLHEVITDECKKIESFTGDGKVMILKLSKLAYEQIEIIHKEERKKITETEKNAFVKDAMRLQKLYYEEVEKYLNNACYNPLTLKTLRQKLLENFGEEIKTAFNSFNTTNNFNLKSETQQAVVNKKIIEKMKIQYNEKMEEMLTKNPDGLDIGTLGRLHSAIQTEIMKLLEMEMRSTLLQDKPIENYQNDLQDHIDNYLITVAEVNRKNIKKKLDRDETEQIEKSRLEEQRKQEEVATKEEQVQNAKARGEYSPHGLRQTTRNLTEIENNTPILPPLVFHLQSSRISMAIDEEGRAEILKNDFEEEQTPAFVVWRPPPENIFIYGSEAARFYNSKSSENSWSIADFFLNGDLNWTLNILINGCKQTITAEFMLAFLLRKLKHSAEKQKSGRCVKTVIAIPFWLSSVKRKMLKDAAAIAGFSAAYLVNETSAAAFNFVLRDKVPLSEEKVLIISENSYRLDAFVYKYSKYDKKVKMISQCCNYSNDRDKKNNFKGRMTIGRDYEFEKDVRDVCKAALSHAAKEFCADEIDINKFLSICENWDKRETLETVAKCFGRKAIGICENAVLYGSVALSRNLEEISQFVRDKLAFAVLRSSHAGGIMVISNYDMPLPVNLRKQATVLSHGHNRTSFYQSILDSKQIIGEMFVEGVSYSEVLEVNLEINNEAIVELKYVMIRSRNSDHFHCVARELVHWNTPNVTKEKLDELTSLLESLLVPPVVKEDTTLTEAKASLLQKCIEIVEKIEAGQFKIKCDLVKGMVLEKVLEARASAENIKSSLEGIEKQMTVLQLLCQKYNKNR